MRKLLIIEGMSCEHCVKAVAEALGAVAGVSDVSVDLDGKTATMEIGGGVTDEMLRAAVEEAGYEARVEDGL